MYLLIVPGRGLVDALIVETHDDLMEVDAQARRVGGILAPVHGIRDFRACRHE